MVWAAVKAADSNGFHGQKSSIWLRSGFCILLITLKLSLLQPFVMSPEEGTRRGTSHRRLFGIFRNRLCVGMNVQLFVDAPDISMNCVRADFQQVGNLFLRMTMRKQIKHLPFTV